MIRHPCWKGHYTGSTENKLEVKDCCSKPDEMNSPAMEVTLGTEDLEFRQTQVNFMWQVETEEWGTSKWLTGRVLTWETKNKGRRAVCRREDNETSFVHTKFKMPAEQRQAAVKSVWESREETRLKIQIWESSTCEDTDWDKCRSKAKYTVKIWIQN